MEQCISRRMILSLVPIQINKKMKQYTTIPVTQQPTTQPTTQSPTYVSDSDEGKMTLQKNSTVTLNFDAANGAFDATIIIENNNDQLITKKEIIKWYDPFTNEIRNKREAISYILGGEES